MFELDIRSAAVPHDTGRSVLDAPVNILKGSASDGDNRARHRSDFFLECHVDREPLSLDIDDVAESALMVAIEI
jgi:hypothetical protein